MALTVEELSCSETDELLSRARAGDAEAFCRLAEQHEARLLRQALGMSGRPDTAEDLVAETLLEAWRSIGRFDGSCQLSTWLFSILLHRHQKQTRRAKSRLPSLSNFRGGDARDREETQKDIPDVTPSPSQDLIHKERILRLRQVIDGIPEKYREVLLLRFFEDASLVEIAAALSCPVGTVKSRLHYALEELRKHTVEMNLEDLGRDT